MPLGMRSGGPCPCGGGREACRVSAQASVEQVGVRGSACAKMSLILPEPKRMRR